MDRIGKACLKVMITAPVASRNVKAITCQISQKRTTIDCKHQAIFLRLQYKIYKKGVKYFFEGQTTLFIKVMSTRFFHEFLTSIFQILKKKKNILIKCKIVSLGDALT